MGLTEKCNESPVPAGGDHVTSGLATIEQVGRGKVFASTTGLVVFFVVVQATMAFQLGERTAPECHTAALLGLLVGAMLALAAPMATYRYYVYIHSLNLDDRYRRLARLVFVCSLVLSGLDALVEVYLAQRSASEPASCVGTTPILIRAQSGLHIFFVLLALLVAAIIWYSGIKYRLAGQDASQAKYTETATAQSTKGGLIICCSGGGIRSASFCLGVLQVLRGRHLYQTADAVIGVSGGGYIASAMHILQGKFDDPYAIGSSELAHLRRQTRYLMPRGTDKFRAVFSLLYGIAVNAALIGIALLAIAWWLGWLLDDLDVLVRTGDGLELHLVPAGGLWYLSIALGPFALAVFVFVVEKAWDRLAQVPDKMRNAFAKVSRLLLDVGVPLAVLLVGVPVGLYLLSRISVQQSGTLPDLLVTLVDPGDKGVLAFGATMVALLGLGRSAWKGLHTQSESTSRLGRVIRVVRGQIAPWAGSALIIALATVLLLRWTNIFATDASARSNWSLAWWMIGIAAAIKVFTDANRTSLHTYYREALSKAFLVEKDRRSKEAVPLPYSTALRYSDFSQPVKGGPRLVIAAAANANDDAFVPARRGCVPFIFDPASTGVVGDRALPRDGLQKTAAYEQDADCMHRDVTVPAAMAISGAAFSPLTGRESARTRPVRILLALLNARLGVWLPNPYWRPAPQGKIRAKIPAVFSWADKPGPYRLLREAFGNPSLYDRWLYVTDGGHYDNLGLVEALRRQPAAVLVLDATSGPDDRFCALAEAVATARMDHCIDIELDPTPMLRGKQKRAPKAWTRGIAQHHDGTTTDIYFLKAQLTGNLSWDVENYSTTHPDFPYTSTGDQLYGEWDFEAYRALGYELAEQALADRVFAGLLRKPSATTPAPDAPSTDGESPEPTDSRPPVDAPV
ncbi:hypothetical protein ACQPZ2_30590 [Nocardia pseudovaccinii]|uniref:hypothetical protein n=1 Tax=Nocardia pseudovaccinii TaxID=189540 RepID=UPI003D91CC0D